MRAVESIGIGTCAATTKYFPFSQTAANLKQLVCIANPTIRLATMASHESAEPLVHVATATRHLRWVTTLLGHLVGHLRCLILHGLVD